MTKQEFESAIVKEVRERLGDGYAVSLRQVELNNGIQNSGIRIMEEGRREHLVYGLAPYWECPDYPKAKDGAIRVADEIVSTYHRKREGEGKLPYRVEEFSEACHRIRYQLVHYGMNERRLSNRPYRHFQDLAVVYYLRLDEEGQTVPVTDELMGIWGMDEEGLYRLASANTPRESPYTLTPLPDFLSSMGSGEGEVPEECPLFYILTSQDYVFGASTMLYPGLMERIAKELGADFYILPSSLHEVLLLPIRDKDIVGELREVVRQVNRESLLPEDVLSGQVYCYLRREGVIRIAGEGEERKYGKGELPCLQRN